MSKGSNDYHCPVCQSMPPELVINPLISMEDILICLNHFRDMRQEYFICLSLDSGRRLIARRIVTIGLLDVSLVHPREVFAGPLMDRAASVIIAHNHPSGDSNPSREDISTTQQLVAAGMLLGLKVNDHIIVTSKQSYSFRLNNLL